jgi:uncharacterized hydrophobic protein (TIGR00341 family)
MDARTVRRDMRVLQVLVLSEGTHQDVLTILEDDELDYVVSDRTDNPGRSAVISVPLPTSSVEHVQSRLEAVDVREDLITIVVDPEAVVTDRFDKSDNPYTEVQGLGYQGISRSELRSKATDMIPDRPIYLLMTAISAIVATTGVLLNSIAVLVGSMVIAPLIGPMMATSVATVLGIEDLYWKSIRFQLVGGGVALGSTVGFAALVRLTAVLPGTYRPSQLVSLSSHTAPSVLLAVVALGAGFVGALSLSTSGTMELIGVMISGAIVPPLGVLGVGLAWLRPTVVVGAGAVVLLNVFGIVLAAVISLWYLGYHPDSLADIRRARSTMLIRITAMSICILLLSVLITHVDQGIPSIVLPI